MKVGTVTRILKEDLAKGGEVPPWIDPFIWTLNGFMSTITDCLANGVSFDDNVNGKQFKLELKHGVEQLVNPGNNFPVVGSLALDGGGKLVSAFGITTRKVESSTKQQLIGVTCKFDGGTSVTKSVVTFVLLFS